MSTRCNIIIEDNEFNRIQFYHHCDGYPEGVGAHLKKLASNYKGEHSVAAFADALEASEEKGKYNNGFEREDCGLHGDIEYLYIVALERKGFRVLCYKIGFDWKREIKCFTKENVIWDCPSVFDEYYELPAQSIADQINEAVAAITPAAFEDAELIAELRRRGYIGTLTKTIEVTL